MNPPKAEPVVHIKDERFTVTEWRFAPGADTGWHVHGHDYVIVPLTDGTLGLEEPGGVTKQAALSQGVPYSRRVGVNHNVTNAGAAPLAFLEIETTHDHAADRRRATLSQFLAARNARDIAAMTACLTEDCQLDAEAAASGRTAVAAALADDPGAFTQPQWTDARQHVVGDTGLAEWRFTGTHPDGHRIAARGCAIFRFDGDLIAAIDSYQKPPTTA